MTTGRSIDHPPAQTTGGGAAPAPTGPPTPARRAGTLLLAAVAVLALVAAATLGYALAIRSQPHTPTNSSADAGFARDMAVHHAQAVEMSFMVRDATSDPAVRLLAYDIATSQQAQLGMMSAWLTAWALNPTDSSRPAMAWMTAGAGTAMSHDMARMRPLPDGRMPGMASAADLHRLAGQRGRAAEITYLKLMIAHHRGGVAMAQAAVSLVGQPAVRQLAQAILDSQTSEITAMQDMLRHRGAPAA